MNHVEDFLKALVTDPRAKEIMQGMKEPANVEEAAEEYFAIAEKLGFTLAKKDLLNCLKAKEQAHQAVAAKAEHAVKEALDETDLDAVAGGAVTDCEDTFSPGEWCFVTDSCAYVITYYDDPSIKLDDTYSKCTNNATVIETRDVYAGEGSSWEEWRTNCAGGWSDTCGSYATKGQDKSWDCAEVVWVTE